MAWEYLLTPTGFICTFFLGGGGGGGGSMSRLKPGSHHRHNDIKKRFFMSLCLCHYVSAITSGMLFKYGTHRTSA